MFSTNILWTLVPLQYAHHDRPHAWAVYRHNYPRLPSYVRETRDPEHYLGPDCRILAPCFLSPSQESDES